MSGSPSSSDIDLIILDLTLPGLTGFDVCRRLRATGVEVPIIMVSASSDPVDVVVGLEIGADDYIIKPFEVRELAARINAKLRRQRTTQSQVRPGRLKFPGLIVDVGRHEVLRDGKPVTLTPTEFDLLALLSASPGRVISRSEMIQKVWGQGADLDLRSVDAHVYRLRRKIEPEGPRPTYIHAVPGIGYRFERRGLNERLAKAQESTPEPTAPSPAPARADRPSPPARLPTAGRPARPGRTSDPGPMGGGDSRPRQPVVAVRRGPSCGEWPRRRRPRADDPGPRAVAEGQMSAPGEGRGASARDRCGGASERAAGGPQAAAAPTGPAR